jgi:hypothetical protein
VLPAGQARNTPDISCRRFSHPTQLRLSGAQLEEKRQAEGAVEEAEEALKLESDDGKRAELAAELAKRQQELDALMNKFAVGAEGWSG